MSKIYKPTAQVQEVLDCLKQLNHPVSIVGGALRAEVLGGTSKDVDIAIICGSYDLDLISKVLNKAPEHVHQTKYAEQSAFLADWRLHGGMVNVIAYCVDSYSTIGELVLGFDFNINSFLWDSSTHIIDTNGFDGRNVLPCNYCVGRRNPERIRRFVQEYPELNWTEVLLDAS